MIDQPAGSPECQSDARAPLASPKPIGGSVALSGVVLAAGIAAIVFVQSRAPDVDFQNAYLVSMSIGLGLVLFVLIQTHLVLRSRGHGRIIPLAILVFLLIFLALFRWDGFSGEMWPQFASRFAAAPMAQRRSVDQDEWNRSVPGLDQSVIKASVDSPGFLGPNRNGVIQRRAFGIPSDTERPKQLWRMGVGAGWSSFAVVGQRAVTMEQRDDEEWLTCYRLADGKLLWSLSHLGRHENALGGVGPRGTPTIINGRVYAQSATGFVWCAQLDTGELIWTADLLEIAGWEQADSEVAVTWGRAASPLVVDGLCVIPLGLPILSEEAESRGLIALGAEDGHEAWRSGEDQISYASPVVMSLAGKQQIVSVNEQTATGHDIQTGEILWTYPWPGQSNGPANCASAIQVDGDTFLLGKGYGGSNALVRVAFSDEKFSAEADWISSRVLKTKFSHACVSGGVAYALSNGMLEAVSLSDGQRRWTQPRRSRAGAGQLLLVEDVLVVQNEAGSVSFVAAESEEYRELYQLPALDSKTWNIPTIAGRHLLVRNDKEAICFLLPEPVDIQSTMKLQ